MIRVLTIILLSLSPGVIESSRTHARIGNYSQYISEYNNCGLSLKSYQTANKCFKYHQKPFEPLTNARNVTNGETPWLVFVNHKKGSCTGSLIDTQWILTAAHCFNFSGIVQVKIWFGTEKKKGKPFFSHEWFIHPLYQTNKKMDMALIKMDKPVPILDNMEYYETNILCLPPKSIQIKDSEYAFVSGWGIGTSNHLKIGSQQIFLTKRNNVDYQLESTDGKLTILCSGDSGSPLWQYFNGRAVIIGTFVTSGPDDPYMKGCSDSINFVMYLPKFIDWILKTVTYNNYP